MELHEHNRSSDAGFCRGCFGKLEAAFLKVERHTEVIKARAKPVVKIEKVAVLIPTSPPGERELLLKEKNLATVEMVKLYYDRILGLTVTVEALESENQRLKREVKHLKKRLRRRGEKVD